MERHEIKTRDPRETKDRKESIKDMEGMALDEREASWWEWASKKEVR
jgi:hypothetical protein